MIGGIEIVVNVFLPKGAIHPWADGLTDKEYAAILEAGERATAEGGDAGKARVDALVATGKVRTLIVAPDVAERLKAAAR